MKRSQGCLNILESEEIGGAQHSKRKKIDSTESEPLIGLNGTAGAVFAGEAISKPIDIFGLNSDVLRNIFSYCSILDLFSMATSSDQMKTLILETSISGRMFDFGELAKCCHILDVFKVFGKQMTNIKIGEMDVQYKEKRLSKLDEILKMISVYCCVDKLKHVDIQYFCGTSVKKRYMHAALPFFRVIKSFSLIETDRPVMDKPNFYYYLFPTRRAFNPTINDFVERIIGNAKSISSIQLNRLNVTGRFFFADHVRNLKSLSITKSVIRVPEGIQSFLESAPALISFKWDDSSLFGMDTMSSHSSNVVYELVAKHVPDLEVFHYRQNDEFMNHRNRFHQVRHFMWPNDQLIRNFRRLRVLALSTMSYDCLKVLAEKNTVEELQALVPPRTNFDFLQTFTNLKSVKFHTYDGAQSGQMNFLSRLPQLTECYVTVSFNFSGLDNVLVKAVETAKDLSVLRIGPSFRESLNFALYGKLLAARLSHGGDSVKPLTLFVKKPNLKHYPARLGQAYRPDVIKIKYF